jgi:hypothetical protein
MSRGGAPSASFATFHHFAAQSSNVAAHQGHSSKGFIRAPEKFRLLPFEGLHARPNCLIENL